MAESAPLLDQSHSENANDFTSSETARSSAILRILKFTTLVLSVVTLALLIANNIVIRNAPFGYYTWGASNATTQLAIYIFVSVIFSVINIAVVLPILINFIVDVVLASGVLAWAIDLVTSLPTEDWCKRYNYPPGYPPSPPEPIPPHPKCEELKLTVRWLMVIAGSLGGIVGVVYIALAVIRVIAILKTRFWRRSTWSLPGGEITFQVSLKLRGQERVASVEQGEDVGPSTGRGPVYL
ncbi:hypothetical protein CVT25_015423 [Psilocybe cyanescens]|uniref:MARVEL domain-containing protein n=1 Tax=Psilocybe cyanescens TaxID=93625 RepID=A0A409WHD1_PSICY|nr:hypothetical protein CVT25_015423 [Psilocybe cyanescens]